VRNEKLLVQSSLKVGVLLVLVVLGCVPDDSPFRAENEVLKRQVAKQESLLGSLQDGNKVMQQQIDLLNQELRDAKSSMEATKTDAKRLTEQMELVTMPLDQAVRLAESGEMRDSSSALAVLLAERHLRSS